VTRDGLVRARAARETEPPGTVRGVRGLNNLGRAQRARLVIDLLGGRDQSASSISAKDGEAFLDNCYPEVVTGKGNVVAKRILHQVMDVADANWRGVGTIPASGFVLNKNYQNYDARTRFRALNNDHEARRRAGTMPPGCDCARVVLGKLYPNECRLFGAACTPRSPIGPCMVSDEGACRIWWSGGVRESTYANKNKIQETEKRNSLETERALP